MKTQWKRWITVGSVGALLLTTGALTPARAAESYPSQRGLVCGPRDVRADYREIHINRSRLQHLYRLRHRERQHGHWAAARHTDREIAHLRAKLHHEVRDVRLDRRGM